MTIRLAIVDDYPIVQWGIQHALSTVDDIVVTLTATTVDGLNLHDVDVLLLDLGADLSHTSVVARASLQAKVVVMYTASNSYLIAESIQLGAHSFLPKSAGRDQIIATIRDTTNGRCAAAAPEARRGVDGLSRREQQVISYIGTGLTHEQTARRLGVSKHTVDTYVKRVRAKLNLGNKAELARLAVACAASTPERG